MLVVRVSILVLLLILMTACQDKNDKTDKDANELTGSKYVSVAQVKRSDIESWLEYSGKLSAVQINDIAPQIPQKIEKIYVSEGDFVKQGTLLVSFDTNTIEQLRVNYENIKKNYERSKELLKSAVIDQKTYDDVEALYISTKASYETSMSNLKIRAPFDGFISNITQKEGENYSPMMNSAGINGLIRIINLSQMKADLSVTDKDLHKIKKGQTVFITSDANLEKTYKGTVSMIASSAHPVSGLYQCEVKLNNPDLELKHNQFARFKIVIQKQSNTLLIPVSAIIDGNSVFVVKEGKAFKRTIETGISNKQFVQVKSGLQVDETVIIEGNIGISDSTSVIIK